MAKLTAQQRKSLPASDFGIPGKRAFPMPDQSHAIAAKRMAPRAEKAGNISKQQVDHIDAMANARLRKMGHTVK